MYIKRYSDADICWIWRYQIRFQEFTRKCSAPRHTPESKTNIRLFKRKKKLSFQVFRKTPTHVLGRIPPLPHLLVCWERSEWVPANEPARGIVGFGGQVQRSQLKLWELFMINDPKMYQLIRLKKYDVKMPRVPKIVENPLMNETLNEIRLPFFETAATKTTNRWPRRSHAFASCSSSAMSAVSCRSWLAVKILWRAAQQQKQNTPSPISRCLFFCCGS